MATRPELALEQVEAIALPHGGDRTTTRDTIMPRAPYYSKGPRGRACCVHVFSGARHDVRGHRCGKIAAVTETVNGEDRDFCAFHASPAVAKRESALKAKWDAEDAARKARWAAADLGRHAPKLRDALQQIAAGHNDARGLAEEVLKEAGVVS